MDIPKLNKKDAIKAVSYLKLRDVDKLIQARSLGKWKKKQTSKT